MKIAIAQLTSVDNIACNFQQMKTLIHQATMQRARLVIFPENSLYMRIKEGESLHEIHWQTEEIQRLQKLAMENNIFIHITLPFKESEDKKLVNASILFSASAEESSKIVYRKIHLFDIELEGQNAIRESDVFQAGHSASTFKIDDFVFGSSICYDIRFAELYGKYVKEEVDAIVVPAAFLVKTGAAHWEVLLRARAIESQSYVLAAAQAGTHISQKNQNLKRETFGHSMVIDPWGEIIAEKKSDVGLIYVELDKKKIVSTRRQIPMKSHRRL